MQISQKVFFVAVVVSIGFFFLKIRFHYVAELAMWLRLASNSQSSCLNFLSGCVTVCITSPSVGDILLFGEC